MSGTLPVVLGAQSGAAFSAAMTVVSPNIYQKLLHRIFPLGAGLAWRLATYRAGGKPLAQTPPPLQTDLMVLD